MKQMTMFVFSTLVLFACNTQHKPTSQDLKLVQNDSTETINVYAEWSGEPILVQHIEDNFRPFIHPIIAPDGKGTLTENSPGHHKHQNGLYWGFTRVNGRDYFHHPADGYWKKVAARIIEGKGKEVKWQTVYDLLDSTGEAIMAQTQNWSMFQDSGRYYITLEWRGEAKTDITIGKYDYGGLFLRMPWKEGIRGEVVNNARQKNDKAEGQRAMWVDVGMQIEGRDDFAHIAIFDHPDNRNYPQYWRVDHQMGVGPATARDSSWMIRKGETEVFNHRLMVYTGVFSDTEITNQWARYTGKTSQYNTTELWKLAQQEALNARFLTPEEAVSAMTVKDGYQVNVWAAEPMMTQPMAFCWDDRGRLWIAENKDYESRGHGFSNAGTSRIIILEDSNHDGRADTRKVFLEDIAFPAALAVGFNGVFIGAPPNLLFVPDRNHDDKAEVKDIEVRLTGWGIRDRHETLNSFHWGPDGWLYGCQGFATPSKVRKPIGKGKLYKHKDPFPEDLLEGEGTDINGGVWRYHPVKDKFEVVAHGFSNPWGIDYDAKGQLFITACVIPHLWHIIPGGVYHRQGGQHFNPYLYDDIKTIADHSHRSAHGGARIYQSDAFPASERGRIFMCNIHEHAILSDILERKGSGFTGKHGDDFMMANNGQWVGFSMEIGPDGGLYALDWHDADICGQTVRNSETGRVFRVMPETSNAQNFSGRYKDLNSFSDLELVNLQTSTSDWHARRARVILQSRSIKKKLDAGALTRLQELFLPGTNADHRLKALWTLHVTQNTTQNMLSAALRDKDEYVRAWAIQLLCEDGAPAPDITNQMIDMAKSDPSPVVRLYLASAMQRTDAATGWQLAEALITRHAEDEGDHNLPKMIWFGFEKMIPENPKRALEIAANSRLTLISRFAARRAVDADATETLVNVLATRPSTLNDLLEGMLAGMEGRVDLNPPHNWSNTLILLEKRKDKSTQLAEEINALFGDAASAQRSFSTLNNRKLPTEQRIKALQTLSAQQRKELLPILPQLLEEPGLQPETIKAMAAYDKKEFGVLLLQKYSSFNDAGKLQAMETLSSRPVYGRLLADAIKNKTMPKSQVPATVARQLRRVVGSGFVEIWGPIDDKPADSKEFDHYKNLVSKSGHAPDLDKGEKIFARTCGSCHKLYGKGGNIGPDLTGSNRSNIDYLLFNILSPSEEIQDDYRMIVITTRDGRTYSGNLVSENDRQITLRVVGQNEVVLHKSSIQSRETTSTSMMPQGLLNSLNDKEVTDLLGYLMRVQ